MLADTSGPVLKVVAAEASQKSVFENLLQLYLYDMAAQSRFPVNADGRYDYEFLERFWEHPYLFYHGDEIAGFCLVINHCPIRERSPCWFMAEFCVLRPYQRNGIGRSALQSVFKEHPGNWEISWLQTNKAADSFWPKVIPAEKAATQRITFDGMEWNTVAFETGTTSDAQ